MQVRSVLPGRKYEVSVCAVNDAGVCGAVHTWAWVCECVLCVVRCVCVLRVCNVCVPLVYVSLSLLNAGPGPCCEPCG